MTQFKKLGYGDQFQWKGHRYMKVLDGKPKAVSMTTGITVPVPPNEDVYKLKKDGK